MVSVPPSVATAWVERSGPARRILSVRPNSSGSLPAIVVVHGVNGLGEHIEHTLSEFAEAGYWAVAPDVYADDPQFADHRVEDIEAAAHMGRDPERQRRFLSMLKPQERDRIAAARKWISARRTDTYLAIVRDAYEFVAADTSVSAIGTFGYCMGGRLVGELAVEGPNIAAHVIYYGSAPDGDVQNIRGAMQGHYAASDHPITDRIPAFAERMAAAAKPFEYFIYDADHGFSLSPRLKSFDPAATALSMERIRRFFGERLQDKLHLASGTTQP